MQHLIFKLYAAVETMKNLLADENGQDMVEYALVVGLIALGATAAMPGLAATIGTAFTNVGNKITTYTS